MGELNRNIRILVVDDFSTMRKLITNILFQLELKNVDTASNGVEALKKIKEKQFDLLLFDWNMPEMSGLELLKETRKLENHKMTPIIMVTAEALKENILAAVQAGATGYIVKPFNPATMEGKIKQAFRVT